MRYARSVSAVVFLASGLLNPAVSTAHPRGQSFANVRFGSDPATVLEAMKGLNLVQVASTLDPAFPFDQRFEGELKGSRALVSALYDADGRLEKVLVAFLTLDEECVPLYRRLKEELRQQYGAPLVDLERWDYPYNNGGHVGQEHFAIRIGRGLLATAWDADDAGSTEAGVSLMTGDHVIIRLAYESSRWSAESDRRKKMFEAESQGADLDQQRSGLTAIPRSRESLGRRSMRLH